MPRFLALAAGLLALAATAAPAHAISAVTTNEPNFAGDGGFETPADGTGVTTYGSGTSLGPWAVSGPGGIDHVGSSLWRASENNLSIDLNGSDQGAISQTLATTAGNHYQLHFALAGNFAGGPAVKTLQVGFGATTVNRSFDSSHSTAGAPGYVCPTYQVKATGGSTPLSFTSTTTNPGGDNFYGPILDDVRVVAAGLTTVTKPQRPTIGQGARKFVLAIKGTNFDPGYVVSMSNPNVTLGPTTFVNSTTLEVPVTVTADAPTGQAFDVTVTGGSVSEFDTCGKSLSISPAPAPTSLARSHEFQGTERVETIHGSNFQPGAVVGFGGGITVEHAAVLDPTTGDLSASIRISPTARVGSRTISVRNPDGGVGICAHCFFVDAN